jgi:ABC-type phosphate transport system auxiliary subunit
MDNFDSEKFEQKLLNLKDTQDSITGLSKWCLNKRTAHKQIVKSWLKTLKEGFYIFLTAGSSDIKYIQCFYLLLVKVENRLTLFYLANDVIQHSKRKKYEFVDSWGTSLQRATTLVRDDKVKEKISRIFHIWQQREIYSEEFIADLNGLLNVNQLQLASTPIKKTQTSKNSSPAYSHSPIADKSDDFDDDFQLSNVVSSIQNCVALEAETDKNLKSVVKITTPDLEKIKGNFKGNKKLDVCVCV